MKPQPFLLQQASDELKVLASKCLLIGDSLTDIQGAHAVASPVIGYANWPGKADLFVAAEPDAIVTAMTVLDSALRS